MEKRHYIHWSMACRPSAVWFLIYKHLICDYQHTSWYTLRCHYCFLEPSIMSTLVGGGGVHIKFPHKISQPYTEGCVFHYPMVKSDFWFLRALKISTSSKCNDVLATSFDQHSFNSSPLDNIFRYIFVIEKCFLIKITLKFVLKGPIDNNPALV